MTANAILDRLVKPKRATLPPAAAKAILQLRFAESDVEKMNKLAEKARPGALTPGERDAIADYERIGQFVSLFKSKARLSLRSSSDN
jgi:hypothetical protein